MKIYIFGATGSGKTTIAKKLSKEYDWPHYELDKMFYTRQRQGYKINEDTDRIELVKTFVNNKSWVTEGLYRKDHINEILERADIIVILDTPKIIRNYRLLIRSAKRKLGLEKSIFNENIDAIMAMIKLNNKYEKIHKKEFLEKLNRLKIKPIVVKNYQEIVNNIDTNYAK